MSGALAGKCLLRRLATRPLPARGRSRPNAVKPHSSALALERGLQGFGKNLIRFRLSLNLTSPERSFASGEDTFLGDRIEEI